MESVQQQRGMDVPRPSPRRRPRRRTVAASALVLLLGVSLIAWRAQPAAPGVERSSLWIGTVSRGPMVRQVTGVGALVPETIRWISATTPGRVERIDQRPGGLLGPQS